MTICRAMGANERLLRNRVPTAGYHLSPTRKVTGMFAVTFGWGWNGLGMTVPASVPV